MGEPIVCEALADNTTPEWARGKVACSRPLAHGRTHAGPHSARVTPPHGGAPVTLTWVEDARPKAKEPPEAGIAEDASGSGSEGEDAPARDYATDGPWSDPDALLVALVERELIPEGMDVAGVLNARRALETMLDEGWEFIPPGGKP